MKKYTDLAQATIARLEIDDLQDFLADPPSWYYSIKYLCPDADTDKLIQEMVKVLSESPNAS